MIEPWDGQPFGGTKLALIHDHALLTYLRDDKPDIPYPNYWDLPGGGREGDESPVDCALRELQEEFGLTLQPERFIIGKRFEKSMNGPWPSYFYIGQITAAEIAAITFGDEGQRWQMMPMMEFLFHEQAVPAHQQRLLALSGLLGKFTTTLPS